MISNKSTPLTEFKLSNLNFNYSSLIVNSINGIEDGLLIYNLLTKEECNLIGNSIFNCLENNEFIKHGLRIHKDSEDFAKIIYDRIENYCVKTLKRKNPTNSNEQLNWAVDSVSPKFRFIRYNEGELFPNHTDGEYKVDNKMSFFSVLIFTNDCGVDFKGGEFRFFKKDIDLKLVEVAKVEPKPGMALIFNHTIIHDSTVITSGKKQTIRSDLIYRLC
ncbi:hypothetical protein RB653_003766 [Dictyostelium firmibasis]|uniref:Fe2OG dioxygenase domain-containing protein n=1 Tax=Dictyostelium firmibasis TaxID=79012 RepID=A0AAN7UI21_9MYCE